MSPVRCSARCPPSPCPVASAVRKLARGTTAAPQGRLASHHPQNRRWPLTRGAFGWAGHAPDGPVVAREHTVPSACLAALPALPVLGPPRPGSRASVLEPLPRGLDVPSALWEPRVWEGRARLAPPLCSRASGAQRAFAETWRPHLSTSAADSAWTHGSPKPSSSAHLQACTPRLAPRHLPPGPVLGPGLGVLRLSEAALASRGPECSELPGEWVPGEQGRGST